MDTFYKGGLRRDEMCCDKEADNSGSPVSDAQISTCTDIVPYRVSEYLSPRGPLDFGARLLKPLAVPLRVAKIAMGSADRNSTLLPELTFWAKGGCPAEDAVIHLSGQDLAIELYDPERLHGQKDRCQEEVPMDTQ